MITSSNLFTNDELVRSYCLHLLQVGQLETILETWLNDPFATGNKREACDRIRKAHITLDLSYLDLNLIPDSVFSLLPNLTKLDLSNNELTSFSPPEDSLTTITELDLSHNLLASFSPVKGSLTSVTDLFLRNNKLTSFSLPEGSLSFLRILGLSTNKLTSFSPVAGSLNALTTLIIAANELNSFSPEAGSLNSLRTLTLSTNLLNSFSPPIDSLPALKELDLSYNPLTSFSPCEGLLNLVTELYLSGTQLTSFSPEEGSLNCLTMLDLSNNLNLNSLPISLISSPLLTHINIDSTSIPWDQLEAIERTTQELRGMDTATRLPGQLDLWSAYAELSRLEKRSLSDLILNFSEKDKREISEWLHRLGGCKDFSTNQKSLAKTACDLLRDTEDLEFREQFIIQIAENNTACGDRAAMGLNEIYVSWKIQYIDKELPLQDKLKIIAGAAKTHALRTILSQKIDREAKRGVSIGESVEIYLYYEHTLAQRLKLVTAIESMLYSEIGKRDWIDEKELGEGVETIYPDIAISLPAFDTLISQDSNAQNRLEAIVSDANEELVQIYEAPKTDQNDLARIEQINNETKSAQEHLKKAWFLKNLEGTLANSGRIV